MHDHAPQRLPVSPRTSLSTLSSPQGADAGQTTPPLPPPVAAHVSQPPLPAPPIAAESPRSCEQGGARDDQQAGEATSSTDDLAAGPVERALWLTAAAVGMFALAVLTTLFVVQFDHLSRTPLSVATSLETARHDAARTAPLLDGGARPILATHIGNVIPAAPPHLPELNLPELNLPELNLPALDPAQAARSLLSVLPSYRNGTIGVKPGTGPFPSERPDRMETRDPVGNPLAIAADLAAKSLAETNLGSGNPADVSLAAETWLGEVSPVELIASNSPPAGISDGAEGTPASVDRIDLPAACPAVPLVEFRMLDTAVRWAESVDQAAMLAHGQGKLLFVLHVSGNFENPGFT
jgi:hypothetical protein